MRTNKEPRVGAAGRAAVVAAARAFRKARPVEKAVARGAAAAARMRHKVDFIVIATVGCSTSRGGKGGTRSLLKKFKQTINEHETRSTKYLATRNSKMRRRRYRYGDWRCTDDRRRPKPQTSEALIWYLKNIVFAASPYNKTSDVFSPEYKANTSRRIGFSADVITNTSSNIRLYTAFAMRIVRICPNITQFTVLTY